MKRADTPPLENPGKPEGTSRTGRTIRLLTYLTLIAAVLAAAGCTRVGPEYQPAEPPAPPQWNTPLDDGLVPAPMTPEALASWWTLLNDPLLDSLEERAVSGNLSVKEAAARVREARAARGISEAALMPEIDLSSSAGRTRSSSDAGSGKENGYYTAGFDASWELDLFGGTQRSIEASQADLEADQASLNDVLVSLTAEVALTYVEFRVAQARLKVSVINLTTQRQTFELNDSRFRAGLIDELAVKQALYAVEHTRSTIPGIKADQAAARNRLAVLLGLRPGTLDAELDPDRPVPVPPSSVAVGVPAETLRRRPDIRQAERNLAARTAEIGVATAELYPKLSLFGTIGLESLTLGNLPEWASRTWTAGPSVSWNLFDAGAVRRSIDASNARQEQALVQYEAVVLTALEEVENALSAYAREQERLEALAGAVQAARKAEELARDRYSTGIAGFNDVLEAQRSLLTFQNEQAVSRGEVTANLIRLFKALGGGW